MGRPVGQRENLAYGSEQLQVMKSVPVLAGVS